MTDDKILETIHYLYDRYWDERLSEEEEDKLNEMAENLVEENGWDKVYKIYTAYLQEPQHTKEDLINAAIQFWNYFWYERKVPDTYGFLSYFYYRIDMQTSQYDATDVLDSLCTNMLPKAGFEAADLMKDPYYMPENDPKMLEYVERWKAGEILF